jgi:polar amino acid transport system permease protein
MNFDWSFFWSNLFTPGLPFLQGLALTVVISVISMALAVLVGLVIALLRRSPFLPFRVFASFYIWLIRGTPLLVQLVIIYTGFAAAGLGRFQDVDLAGLLVKAAVQAAVVGLVINESAYISEIIRAGLDSVPIGQYEAAQSLGMSYAGVMRWVIVPQALLSVIGVSEMFLVSQTISSATFKTFEIFAVVALYYLLLTTIWTVVQSRLEKRLNSLVGIEATTSAWQRLFGGKRVAVPIVEEA